MEEIEGENAMPTRKWGTEVLVNTTVAAQQSESSVALLADGTFIVVWSDLSSGDSAIRGQRFSATGEEIGGEMLLFSDPGLDQTAPDVTGLSDGNFHLAWNRQFDAFSDDDVEGRVFTPSGAPVRFQLQDSNSSAQDEFDGDVAAFSEGGGSALVWRDNTQAVADEIRLAIFDAGGLPVTPNSVVVTTGDAVVDLLDPHVSIAPGANGNILVTYTVQGFSPVLNASLYTSAGFFLDTVEVSGVGRHPASAFLADGSFVVAWTENPSSFAPDVMARMFDADGTPVGDAFRVHAGAAGVQTRPDIVALPGGGFVIAWEDANGDGSGTAIRLQAFDAAGAKIGGEIIVNTTTTGNQFDVSLAALDDGRVAVTWTDGGPDEVRMQIVDPRDGIVAGTGNADTLYGHASVGDEISGFGGADILRGLKGDDSLYGGEGDDTAEGGGGEDTAYGGAGGDSLNGGGRDDDLFGEADDDTLIGGKGDDALNGGSGVDTASYAGSDAGVNVSLLTGFAAGGHAAGDTFSSIENLTGSGLADTLNGGTGANRLDGGAGDDILLGRAGGDALVGGTGTDTASYSDSNAAVNVSLATGFVSGGHAVGDTFSGIENLTGSAFADILNGSGGANALSGGAGADSLVGNAGADRLTGGAGLDTLTGGADSDTMVFLATADSAITSATADRIVGFAAGDRIDVFAIDANSAVALDQGFVLDTNASFSAGEIRQTVQGGDLFVEFNVDADATAEMAILLQGRTALLAIGDFIP